MGSWSEKSEESVDQLMKTFDPLHHSTPLRPSSFDVRKPASSTQNSFLNDTAERVTMSKDYLDCSLDFIDISDMGESGPHTTGSLDFNDAAHVALQL